MPCYFFHLEEGDTTLDFPGMELLNLRAAREEAMRTAVEMLLDRAKVLPWSTEPWRLWVTDGLPKRKKRWLRCSLPRPKLNYCPPVCPLMSCNA